MSSGLSKDGAVLLLNDNNADSPSENIPVMEPQPLTEMSNATDAARLLPKHGQNTVPLGMLNELCLCEAVSRSHLAPEGEVGSNHNSQEPNLKLQYQLDYPIRRTGRKWRRQEVQGVCCLSLEITCLAALACISMHALGYMDEDPQAAQPYSFSAKILREFYTYEETPMALTQCYYEVQNLPPHMYAASSAVNGDSLDSDFDFGGAFSTNEVPVVVAPRRQQSQPILRLNTKKGCNYKTGKYASEWLLKFFGVNFLSMLTLITSGMFLLSLDIRRKKGLQVALLLPPFVCFFISIFQQIPITFHYNYVNLVLREDIRNAMSFSASSSYNSVPILDETQYHMECCGMDNPTSWELLANFNGSYPGSCCNTEEFDCAGKHLVDKKEIWTEGCFHKEYERTRKFEKWSLILMALKIIAEVGLFCSLSDLTRFEYPRPETIENSRVEFRDYLVKCRGVASIKGVTKDGRIVVKTMCLLPWRLIHSRTDLLNGTTLHIQNDVSKNKGSIEVTKRFHLEDFRNEDIEIDFTRRGRGIYIFVLR